MTVIFGSMVMIGCPNETTSGGDSKVIEEKYWGYYYGSLFGSGTGYYILSKNKIEWRFDSGKDVGSNPAWTVGTEIYWNNSGSSYDDTYTLFGFFQDDKTIVRGNEAYKRR